jgi:fucose permease
MIVELFTSGVEGIPVSYSPRTDDTIALTLLVCFFLSSIALAKGKKFLSQQVKDFVLHRERTSIFDSSTAADVRYLLVLVLQTCVLSGITFFNYFHDTFEAIMFPTIFSIALTGLGNLTKTASSLLMMTPIGGCGFLLMGLIADRTHFTLPFLVPLVGFVIVLAYAAREYKLAKK